jgi:hypothetical protein
MKFAFGPLVPTTCKRSAEYGTAIAQIHSVTVAQAYM